ncbi:MAG: hypothetical protein HRT74_09645, partial [Flavobacteriales bacterium]|nr:hypothetical protein [Flavobacteriales bacterium]
MKKWIITSLMALTTMLAMSQTDGMNYQAVILSNEALEIPGVDITGHYLRFGEVRLLFTIYDSNQAMEFQEYHDATTDGFGMVNVTIGHGVETPSSPGAFNDIVWAGTPKSLKVELAYQNNEFEEIANEELLYVPYGYHRDAIVDGTLNVYQTSDLFGDLTVNA